MKSPSANHIAHEARFPHGNHGQGEEQRQRAKGKVKETTGKVTGNAKLERKGKADQTKGNLKQAGEKLKDAFR